MPVQIDMPVQLDLPVLPGESREADLRALTPATRRTILFLIADTGAGHRCAANAIARALRLLEEHEGALGAPAPATDVHIVDVFATCARLPLREAVSLYGPVTTHSPRLYGYVFRLTNSARRFAALSGVCQPLLRQGLRELIAETRPDVVVSVHPLLNHVTLRTLADLDLQTPLVTVITDLASAHAAWFAPGVAACVVPTPVVRDLALAHGIDARRVRLLGMPIDPAFALPAAASRAERRAALGLDADLPVVLVTGGGEGAGGLAETVWALASRRFGAQLLVVTGRNRRLHARLRRRLPRLQMPTRLYGFVRNMPELMRAADVVVTKAGPGTITEAIACELPIVLTGAIPGQEEGNVRLVLEHGLGVLAPTPASVACRLGELLDPASERLRAMRMRMRANALAVSRPRAAFDIARLIASACRAPAPCAGHVDAPHRLA